MTAPMGAIRIAVGLALALLAAPGAAAADDDFPPGEWKGTNGQDRAVKFAADPSGVHIFSTRLALTCAGGAKSTVRIWIPHIHLDLEATRGQFMYTRRRGSDDVLRVTGILAGAIATGTVSRRKGRCRSGVRPWTAAHSGAGGPGHDHHSDPNMRVGNHAPYPAVELASARNRRRADALRLATNAAAWRFATVALAESRGYIADPTITPVYRPGIVHFRKNRVHFWGRVLEPRRPQALIFWCPPAGECHLVALMYRAPPDSRPPTYGGLIGWHRHSLKGTWMTHVWLTGDVGSALAQCVPFNAITAYNPLVAFEPYRADIPGLDEPCSDTAGLAAPAPQASG